MYESEQTRGRQFIRHVGSTQGTPKYTQRGRDQSGSERESVANLFWRNPTNGQYGDSTSRASRSHFDPKGDTKYKPNNDGYQRPFSLAADGYDGRISRSTQPSLCHESRETSVPLLMHSREYCREPHVVHQQGRNSNGSIITQSQPPRLRYRYDRSASGNSINNHNQYSAVRRGHHNEYHNQSHWQTMDQIQGDSDHQFDLTGSVRPARNMANSSRSMSLGHGHFERGARMPLSRDRLYNQYHQYGTNWKTSGGSSIHRQMPPMYSVPPPPPARHQYDRSLIQRSQSMNYRYRPIATPPPPSMRGEDDSDRCMSAGGRFFREAKSVSNASFVTPLRRDMMNRSDRCHSTRASSPQSLSTHFLAASQLAKDVNVTPSRSQLFHIPSTISDPTFERTKQLHEPNRQVIDLDEELPTNWLASDSDSTSSGELNLAIQVVNERSTRKSLRRVLQQSERGSVHKIIHFLTPPKKLSIVFLFILAGLCILVIVHYAMSSQKENQRLKASFENLTYPYMLSPTKSKELIGRARVYDDWDIDSRNQTEQLIKSIINKMKRTYFPNNAPEARSSINTNPFRLIDPQKIGTKGSRATNSNFFLS